MANFIARPLHYPSRSLSFPQHPKKTTTTSNDKKQQKPDKPNIRERFFLCSFFLLLGTGVRGAVSLQAGSVGEWTEELELQRRAVALTVMTKTGRGGGGATGGLAAVRGHAAPAPGAIPVWARVARVQALQSLALQAPRDRDLRAALYEVNIARVSKEEDKKVHGCVLYVLRLMMPTVSAANEPTGNRRERARTMIF